MTRIITSILLCGLLFPQYILSQSEDSEAYKKQIWEEEAFETIQIPENYLGASCVNLNRAYEFQIRHVPLVLISSAVEFIDKTHQRVKILDRAGIEEFSSFSFTGGFDRNFSIMYTNNVYAGFKIIKNDGREIEVDIRNLLVKDQTENKKILRTLNKISIPDLEVGDVLDYYIIKTRLLDYKSYALSVTEAQDFFLPNTYPVVNQTITIRGLEFWKLYSKSFNGAPTFKDIASSEKELLYQIEDKNRDAIKDEIWFNPYKELPFVRFQLRHDNTFSFKAKDKTKLVETISSEDLKDNVKYLSSFKLRESEAQIINNRIKLRKPKTQKEKLMRVFDEAKRYNLGMSDRVNFINGTNAKDYSKRYRTIVLSSLLTNHKIPHSILITTDDSEIMLDDVFLWSNIYHVIRIDEKSPCYISNLEPFSVLTDISPDIAGNKAYSYQVYPKVKNASLKSCTIPMNDYKANSSKSIINVALSLDALNTHLNVTHSVKNALRYPAQHNLINTVEYFDAYESHFGEKEFVSLYRSSRLKKEYEKIEEIRKEQSRKREEYLKDFIKNDFDLANEFELSSFEIVDMGLFNQGNEFKYSITGTVNDLIRKVGSNYIFEAGKLISNQVSLNEQEKKTRHYNIYNNNPRSFESTISIEIPNGYTVKGLELFNNNVESKVGGYKSNAVQEGNNIIITSYKYYTQPESDKSLWNEYVPFLDAAFDLSQKQLLFEKM